MHGVGGIEDVKKQLQYPDESGLKIGNNDLDEDGDEEAREIKQAIGESFVDDSYYTGGKMI